MSFMDLIKGEIRDGYQRFFGKRVSLSKLITDQGITSSTSPFQKLKNIVYTTAFMGMLSILPASIGTSQSIQPAGDNTTKKETQKAKIAVPKPIPINNSGLRADILENAGTIKTGKKIHKSIYRMEQEGFLVPDTNYFAVIDGKRINAHEQEGSFIIPVSQNKITTNNYVRIGLTKNDGTEESIRTQVEKYFQKPEKRQTPKPVFPQEYSVREHVRLAQNPRISENSIDQFLDQNSIQNPSTEKMQKNFGTIDNIVEEVFELQNKGVAAWETGKKLRISTDKVYEIYKQGFEQGNKYWGTNTKNVDAVRANKKMLYNSFMFGKDRNQTFDERAEELFDKGFSVKEILKQLSEETRIYEISGRRMNVNKNHVYESLEKKGKFFKKYFLANKDKIEQKFADQAIMVKVNDHVTKSFYMPSNSKDNNYATDTTQTAPLINTVMAR